MPENLRIGFGYDLHRLEDNRKLVLGGVVIPFEKGLAGHSDADVLLHAVIDALLGASALGDIGALFPDTDPAYEGADSRMLLRETVRRVREAGFQVVNTDATVVAERPRLQPWIPDMRRAIAGDLGVETDAVSVKATTSEKIGMIGRGEGISATAVCLLSRSEQDRAGRTSG